MKPSPILLLLLLAGIALAWVALRSPEHQDAPIETRAEIPAHLTGAAPEGCVLRSFKVDGMCCEGCTATVHEALSGVQGVTQVAVSFAETTALAYVREDVDVELLRAAADAEGYELRSRE
jgi:copper chaperone CopZ